jgi:hypothetical protein
VFALAESTGNSSLANEFLQLFPVLERLNPFNPNFPQETTVKLKAGAAAALVHLKQLGGWLQGLIDELTYEQRMRVQAEENAKQAARPGVGFGT